MDTKSHNMLALNPGTRYMGVAIFYRGELIDWGVKAVTKRTVGSSTGLAISVISKLIEIHQIDALILKALHPSRSSPFLHARVRSIKNFAKKRKIVVREYDITELKRTLVDGGRMNKNELMRAVVNRYSFLAPDLDRALREKQAYYTRMFEAVALGVKYLDQAEDRGERSAGNAHNR